MLKLHDGIYYLAIGSGSHDKVQTELTISIYEFMSFCSIDNAPSTTQFSDPFFRFIPPSMMILH